MPDIRETPEGQPNPVSSKRTPTDKEVPRARPDKGKIDHASLTREIIARYPKILAALAK